LQNVFPALSVALALTLNASLAFAQQMPRGPGPKTSVTFTDPANLGDERVKPRDGRELPIDHEHRCASG
jgi:hypothetical protein